MLAFFLGGLLDLRRQHADQVVHRLLVSGVRGGCVEVRETLSEGQVVIREHRALLAGVLLRRLESLLPFELLSESFEVVEFLYLSEVG